MWWTAYWVIAVWFVAGIGWLGYLTGTFIYDITHRKGNDDDMGGL
jgi:hypothetical protein